MILTLRLVLINNYPLPNICLCHSRIPKKTVVKISKEVSNGDEGGQKQQQQQQPPELPLKTLVAGRKLPLPPPPPKVTKEQRS